MNATNHAVLTQQPARVARIGNQAEVLGEIYQPECNLAVWQRDLEKKIEHYMAQLAESNRQVSLRCLIGTGEEMRAETAIQLNGALPTFEGKEALVNNICELVEMYQCLFEPEQIGVRLATLRRAMCPKFHVDFLPARLVTCFSGAGTHWLPEPQNGCPRIPETEPDRFEQISTGDVALLKGDGWFENEGFGVVHRSPPVAEGGMRMFLSLDFAD
ncbi:DUF1826 domain-containing protein [Marinobacterium lutimaris]|uniref:DUF1826 domain-containing protein n=1 Tax=Marinobacterium lutimaris TaxID=568106 RepID=A0A1H5YPH8_9GAMM|nr:DUF1826 domain-containing protein [Marinobacterium lutimaris]SEG26023.1 Protein of unknown function [Marinobacterium lutimaris]